MICSCARPGAGHYLAQPTNSTVWSRRRGQLRSVRRGALIRPDTFQWKEAGNGTISAGATSSALNLDPVPLTANGNLVAVGFTNNSTGVILSTNATLGVVTVSIRPTSTPYSNTVANESRLFLAYFPMDNNTSSLRW